MTLQQKLAEAKSAYHDLLIGAATVSFTKNGRAAVFSQANRPDLKNYIDELELEISQTNGSIRNGRRRGPMGVLL